MKNAFELYNLIGKNMKQIREKKIKISQEKFADEMNMSRSFLSQIESQKVDKGISLDTLFLISQKYDFDIRDFFNNYEDLLNHKNNN